MAEKLRLDVELNIDQSRIAAQTKDIIRKARQLDREFSRIGGGELRGISQGFKQAGVNIDALAGRVKRTNGFLSEMGHQAGLTARRFVTYNVIARTFFLFANGVSTLASEFVKFNAAINRAEQILNPLVTSVDDLKRSVFELGSEFGVSVKEVQAAQEIFIRQGLNLKDTVDLTRASLALSAATAVDTAEATEALTSILRQFNLSASQSIAITDKLVATTINFAVEQKDLDQGLRRSAGTASIVGVKFEELTGFITAAQEATRRGGEVIGTALRTIFTRIFRTPSIEALEELGIRTRELTGDFRSATAILSDLAARFQGLSQAQQLSITSTIAGQRQISTLIALLNNWDRATQATNVALTAQGTAAELTRKRQQALEVQLQKVVNQFVEFGTTIGDLVGQDILDIITGVGEAFKGTSDAIKTISGAGLENTFGNVVGLLTKAVFLVGLQATGISQYINNLFGALSGQTKINEKLAQEFKTRHQIVGLTKGQTEELGRRLGLIQKDSKLLEDQATILKQHNSIRTLGRETERDAVKVAELNKQIQQEEIAIKVRSLTLTKQETAEKKLQAEEQKIINADIAKRAAIQARLDRARLSPEAKAGNEAQRLALNEKIVALVRKKAEIDTTSNERALQVAKQIVEANERIALIKSNFEKARGGVVPGSDKDRLLNQQLIVDLNREEGIIGRANAALKKDGLEAAADIQLQLLRAQRESTNLTEKETARRKEQRDAALTLAQQTNATNNALKDIDKQREGIQKTTADLLKEQENSYGRILNLGNRITGFEKTTVTRKRQIEIISRQIEENQHRLNAALDKQNEKITKGGKGFAKAFQISLLFGALSDTIRRFGKEGSQSVEAVTAAVGGLESALTSLAFVGGPLGLILAGISLIGATSKVFKALKVDTEKTFSAMQDNLEKTINQTRVFTSSLQSLSEVTKKVSAGGTLEVEDFNKVNSTLDDIAKATGVATSEMLGFRNSIIEAVKAGDFTEVTKQIQELQRFLVLRQIAEGNILNKDTIKEVQNELAEVVTELNDLQERQRRVRGGEVGILGDVDNIGNRAATVKGFFDTISNAVGILDGRIKEAQVNQKKLQDSLKLIGQQGLEAFQQVLDPSKSFEENLRLLGEETTQVLRDTGQLSQAYEILARRQGLIATTSLKSLLTAQTAEEADNVKKLAANYAEAGGDIRTLIGGLNELGVASDAAAEVGLRFKEGFFDTQAGQEFIKILAFISGQTEQVIKDAITQNKAYAQGLILVRNAQGNLALAQKDTGVVVTELDKRFAGLVSRLDGQVVPVALKVAQSTEAMQKAYLSSSVIISSWEQRLAAATRITQQSTSALIKLSEAVQTTESNMGLLKEVMAEEVFREPIAGLDDLVTNIDDSSVALNSLMDVMNQLSLINDKVAISVDNDLRNAMARGADGAALFNSRIKESLDGVEQAEQLNIKLAATLDAINRSGNLGFVTSELQTLAKQRVGLETLAQALNGLVAFRDKLDASSKGAGILENDRKSAEKFLETIKTILPGVNIDNIKKFLTFSGSQAGELKQSLEQLFNSIQIEAGKIADPALRQVVSNFGQAITDAIQAASAESGKSSTRILSNALLKDVIRFTESSKALFDAFVSAAGEFSSKNAEQLKVAIDLTQKRLDEMAAATAKGSFLPDFSGKDIEILRQNFARIRVAVAREKDILEAQLKPIKDEITGLIQLTTDFQRGNTFNRSREQDEQTQKRLNDLKIEEAIIETRMADIRNTERTVTANFIRSFAIELDRLTAAEKNIFAAQDAIVQAEIALADKRLEFTEVETFGVEKKIALIEQETAAIERLTRETTGLGDLDVEQIAANLVNLTGELSDKRREGADSATIKIIENRIATEQRYLEIVKTINDKRLSSLTRELELIQEQSEAVRGLALDFIKANDAQQKEIINSARLVEKFFGNLTPQSLDSREFQESAARFLRETNDEMRNAVITQLERLKNVGGEVAPGVQAGEVLRQLSESVVGALFKSPQEALMGKQVELQTRILDTLLDANQIAELQSRLAVQTANDIRRSVDNLLLEGAQGTLDPNDETIKRATEIQSTLAAGQEQISKVNKDRAIAEGKYAATAEQSAIRNKALVDTFSRLDTSTENAKQSTEEYQNELVKLRDALITAEDGFIDAQDAYTQALGDVNQALIRVSVAQSDYALQLSLAQRETLAIAGGFTTFHEEIQFLQSAFNKQILALKTVGAAEEEIANLRVRLAQETLSVLEKEISSFRSNAEALFVGGPDVAGQFQQNFAAAQFAATQAQAVGIAPGIQATTQQIDELFQRLAGLPSEVKSGILEGLRSAPPGATFGGFSAKELENAIISGAGGGIQGDTILELEKQAAVQRQIIAENSIQSLVSVRQGVATAFNQLATAQEQLLEAKAQRDLAQMQLDAATFGFSEVTTAIDIVAEKLTSMDGNLSAFVNRIGEISFGSVTSAAGGTLSGSEVAGLLRAASREKAAMPAGSQLGVFNTSETVLTRRQMNRLRGGASIPNAADGTATVIDAEVVGLLQQISDKLTSLQSSGAFEQNFNIDINNQRTVSVQGLAGIQTALQDILSSGTSDLYTREEAAALERIVMTVVQKMQQTGQISAIGT